MDEVGESSRGLFVNRYWEQKKVLITGATGLVGSWLIRKLVEEGAHVTAFVRDFNPQSEFFRSKDYKNTAIVQGSLEDFAAIERAINEQEIDTVFHLGAQTIVGTIHLLLLRPIFAALTIF